MNLCVFYLFSLYFLSLMMSQEISSGSSEQAIGSKKTVVDAQVDDVAVTVAAVEADGKNFELLKKSVEEIVNRLDNIHKFMLDLGNYYFAFQGVCLAAISNTSFFVCNNAWFLTLLSILSAIPSLTALGFLAHEWINLMKHFDSKLAEITVNRKGVLGDDAGRVDLWKNYHSVLSGRKYSYVLRYFMLVVGVVIIIIFTGVVASWPHVMICKNNGRSVFDKKGI